MTYKVDNCQLEVDEARGVVYVHGPEGITLVRVCKIPAYGIKKGEQIDVTDWRWRDQLGNPTNRPQKGAQDALPRRSLDSTQRGL